MTKDETDMAQVPTNDHASTLNAEVRAQVHSIDRLGAYMDQAMTEARRIDHVLRHGSLVEIAAVNSNVMETIKHWEERTVQAEKELYEIRKAAPSMGDTDWRPTPCPVCGDMREAARRPVCRNPECSMKTPTGYNPMAIRTNIPDMPAPEAEPTKYTLMHVEATLQRVDKVATGIEALGGTATALREAMQLIKKQDGELTELRGAELYRAGHQAGHQAAFETGLTGDEED